MVVGVQMPGGEGADVLSGRIQALQDSLQQGQIVSDEAEGMLEDLGDQLSGLRGATVPIYTRTQALTWARQNIAKVKALADEVLEHLDVSRKVEKRIQAGPSENLDRFLGHVQQLNKAIVFLEGHETLRSASSALKHARELRHVAMQHCEAAFSETLLKNSTKPRFHTMAAKALSRMEDSRPPKNSSGPPGEQFQRQSLPPPDLEPPQVVLPPAVVTLRRLADMALSGGDQRESTELLKSYVDKRRAVLEVTLEPSGLNPAAREDLVTSKIPWDILERRIQGWIILAHVLTQMMLAERDLARSVFRPPYDDLTFSEVVAGPLESLVQYGFAICAVKRTPEKVFALLDMQEHLSSLQGPIRDILDGATCGPLLNDVEVLLGRLATTAHSTFAEFEDAVGHNSAKHVVADGTVHPLTAYVINYVQRLFSYRGTLVTLFHGIRRGARSYTTSRRVSAELDADEGVTPLSDEAREEKDRIAGAIINILVALLENLEKKARLYKSEALQSLFLMNNLNFVVSSMQSYGSSQLLPEDWVSRHRALVNTYKSAYLRASWEPVFEHLREELVVPSSKAERKAIKQRFKAVNQEIKGLAGLHPGWAIPDGDLCEEVRRMVLAELLPLYGAFVAHYRDTYFTKKLHKYMIYTDSDLSKMVEEDLFSR